MKDKTQINELFVDYCALSQILDIQEFYLQNKNIIDFNYVNRHGYPPLVRAALSGRIDTIRFLLSSSLIKKKADIEQQDTYERTALIQACQFGSLDIVQYLLESKDLAIHANMYHQSTQKMNSLCHAMDLEHRDIAHYLIIEQNMNVDSQTIAWLEQRTFHDIVQLVEKRDLYYKMNAIENNKNIYKRVKL